MSTMTAAAQAGTTDEPWLRHFPITFFAVVMGLAGLSLATRRMEVALFGAGGTASLVLTLATAATFCVIAAIYIAKALRHTEAMKAEWNNPVRIAFFPAITIGVLLVCSGLLPRAPGLVEAVWIVATAVHLVIILGVVSAWISHRTFEQAHLTPAWFIPAVGNVLVPAAGVELGYLEVSWFFFSVGMLFWVIFLTLVFNRLIFHNPIAERLLPTLVILIAPPSVGFVAWMLLNGGVVDAFARVLYYSALMFVLVMLTQVGRLLRLPFSMAWWAYSFPVAAFTIASALFAESTGASFQRTLSFIAYGVLCAVIAMLVAKTFAAMRRNEICRPEG